jgi:hypothetical protein
LAPAGRCNIYPVHPRTATLDDLERFTLRGLVMSNLLQFIDPGPIHRPPQAASQAVDVREWAELARRLTVPYYEEARFYLERAVADGFFRDRYHAEAYQPDLLKRVIEQYGPPWR